MLPPSGNTGGKVLPVSCPVAVDWLNFTFRSHELGVGDDEAVGAICSELEAILGRGTFEAYKGLHGFERGVRCATSGAVVCWGGVHQRGAVWVSLPGSWFGLLADREALTWLHLALLDRVASITRIDLCVDFFAGEVSMSDAVEWYRGGVFTVRGRPPSSRLNGDWLNGKAGRTLYVGHAKHGKLVRVYEKGKQLGDPRHAWVRIEVQFVNVDRSIPLDVLDYPARYFAGAAQWPFAVADGWLRIRTRVEREAVSRQKLIHEARRSYGQLLAYMQREGCDADEVASMLTRPGTPRRLQGLSGAALVAECNARSQEVASCDAF